MGKVVTRKARRVFLGGPRDCKHYLRELEELLRHQIEYPNLRVFYHDGSSSTTITDTHTSGQKRVDGGDVNPKTCDVMIMLFNRRVGTPYENYPSYSAYEIETALGRKPAPKVVLIRNDIKRYAEIQYQDLERNKHGDQLQAAKTQAVELARLDDYWNSLKGRLSAFGQRLHVNTIPFDSALKRSVTDLMPQLLKEISDSVKPKVAPVERGGTYPYVDREYKVSDGKIFFGRERDTRQILDQLDKQPNLGMYVIQGPSGMGKSSLLQAGLLYRLERQQRKSKGKWAHCLFQPSDADQRPFRAFADRLDRLGHFSDPASMTEKLIQASRNVDSARETIEELLSAGLDSNTRLIIAINQLEELWTRVQRGLVEPFLNFLAAAATCPRTLVLATIRDDFITVFKNAEQISTLFQQSTASEYPLRAPAPREIRDIIQLPGNAVKPKIDFEEGFVDLVAQDAHRVGDMALPLVSLMLQTLRLPDARGKQVHEFRIADYERLGGLHGIVRNLADKAGSQQNSELLRLLFHNLVRVVDSSPDRRPVFLDAPREQLISASGNEKSGAMVDLIEKLAESRLLYEHDGRIRLAYESLVEQWDELRSWHRDNAWDLSIIEEQRRDATLWARRRKGTAYLKLRSERLKEIEEILEQQGIKQGHSGDKVLDEYLEACRLNNLRSDLIISVKGGHVSAAVKALRSLGKPPLKEEDRGTEISQLKPAFWAAITGDDSRRDKYGKKQEGSIFDGEDGDFEMLRATSRGLTPLCWAAIAGQVELLRRLLAKGDRSWQRLLEDGSTLVETAAVGGNVEAISLLVEKAESEGADPFLPDRRGNQPILWAIQENHNQLVEYLRSKGQSLDVVTSEGFTAMTEAARGDNLEVMRELVEKNGQDPKVKTKADGLTALHFNCLTHKGDGAEVGRMLVGKYNVDIHARSDSEKTPLHLACEQGKLAATDILLAAARERDELQKILDAKDSEGETPLHSASWGWGGDKWRTVQRLLAAGVDCNVPNLKGLTPLYVAVYQGHHRTVQALLEAGADTEVFSRKEWSPLCIAADDGDVDMVEMLLHAKAINPNGKIDPDWTPLMVAARKGNAEIVSALLKAGADLALRDSSGKDAMSIAYASGHVGLVEDLKAWARTHSGMEEVLDRQRERERRAAMGETGAKASPGARPLEPEPATLEEAIETLKPVMSHWGSEVDAAAALGWTRTVRALIAKGSAEPVLWGRRRVSDAAWFLTFVEMDADYVRSLKELELYAPHLAARPGQRRIRRAQLDFFPGCDLVAVEDLNTPGQNEQFFVKVADFSRLLTWKNPPIFDLAERCAPNYESDESLVQYCLFFFHFVRGELGRFQFVERPDQIPWLASAPESLKAEIAPLLHPLVILERAEDHVRLNGTVLFKDGLFTTDLLLAKRETVIPDSKTGENESFARGQMKLFNEELLKLNGTALENLPVFLDKPPGVFG